LNWVPLGKIYFTVLTFFQFIAKNAGLPYRVEQTNYHLYHPLFKLKFGNAILSKYPINSARLLTFDPLSKLEDIAFGNHDGAIVTLNLGESDRGHKTVSIVALHLEVRDRNSRLKTFEKLEHLLLEQKIPTILAGDLNSIKSTDGTNRSIIDKLTALHGVEYYPNQLSSSPLFTFPTEAPSKTLDWIVTSPNVSLMDGKIATVLWSDHLPVIATLMLH
jgi:endonuclease/exonuclease/phosphatase family metal-dependent hydrolase